MIDGQTIRTLRDSLPYNCTALIKAKLHRVSKRKIAEVLNSESTDRLDIINAAVEVLEDHKGTASSLTERINQATN